MTIRRLTLSVTELDCADEVIQLRKAFENCPGIHQLDFDVLHGRMHLQCDLDQISQEEILARVKRAGMHGEWWSPQGHQRDTSDAEVWQRRGRLAVTVAAGIFLMTAFISQLWLAGDEQSLVRMMLGHGEATVPPFSRVCYLLSILFGGWFVAPRAWASLLHLRADMNLLMCVAVVGAIALGQWSEAAVVTFLFAVSLLLEQWSMGRARQAITSLMDATPQQARCLGADGGITEKRIDQVNPGERVIVRPGEKVPLDGVVREGESNVDQSPITGESQPVSKRQGDAVYAGTINQDGVIRFEVTCHSTDTTFARIIHLVEEAQASRAPAEQWVERFARYYTPSMMGLAVLIAVGPPLLWSAAWSVWIYNALVLLVIACPCALVISTPVTIVSALTSAARVGVLIKGGRFLEVAAGIQALAIDKTGTLTHGRPTVGQVIPFTGHTREELLQRAASMEAHSTHPIAIAILDYARAEKLPVDEVEDYRILGGQGAEATIQGNAFWIGSHRLWKQRAADAGQAAEVAARLQQAGNSVVAVGNAEHVCGLIGIADSVRDGAAAAMQSLRQLGLVHIEMISGDNQLAVNDVAAAVHIDHSRGELLPEDKVRVVSELRDRFRCVAMVGDGVNDAPALAAASLSIAMGAIGTDTAIETADVALMSDDLSRIPWLIQHGRRAVRVIKQNMAFALGIKLLFVLLAISGMASLWMAIMADTGASLLVIANGMRLLKT